MKNNAPSVKKGTIRRVLGCIRRFYPAMLPATIFLILFNAAATAIPSIFMQKVIAAIEDAIKSGEGWEAAAPHIIKLVLILVGIYLLSLASGFVYHQLLAVLTQGTLKKLRTQMFNGMQDLPIGFFDSNNRGDIMSHYTNDIDTLRQMISQSLPQIMATLVVCTTLVLVMLWFSLWMTLVVVAGIAIMLVLTRKIGGGSAKYFVRQQQSLGKVEGYVEEMMNGQKVVRVFNREEACMEDFDRLNDQLFDESRKANRYANILGPVLNNFGNILYVIVAVAGGLLLVTGAKNVSVSGYAFGISIVVPFLNMTKQFAGNVGQVSHQINSVIMGMAGAQRIFDLIDREPESDSGYVTLVNAREENGALVPCEEHTGIWAWRHPHEDGTVTYTRLEGDVRFFDVDFEYRPNHPILHDVSLYAKPGQKVAFVGATGAGKTTITNLINRFYDIADGKIRYDGININKIRKSDLRRSLGMVLQDTNLFTGTVMENIRYGKLDATDGECIAAAKLAGADDFITGLPDGYDTVLSGNGANLSQGQRQLLSIARAAVADPPVMILDEATSSIDTRTEQIVQRGMDALMKGRTVFVIAHRLSTVKNSDVIIVLDHGRIIERGTHDDLIAQKGQYYQLYTGAFELE